MGYQINCVDLCIVCVNVYCILLLSAGVKPIAVNKYIISYLIKFNPTPRKLPELITHLQPAILNTKISLLLYPVLSRVERIMHVIPRGTELELQLRRGVGQTLYTCNNIQIKCTGVYWAQAEKYCYK